MIGKEILGYRVDEKIGSGGFGTVYKVSKTNAAGTYVRALKHITLPTKKQYASVLNSMGGDYAKADDYFAGVLKDIVSEIQILSTLSESGTQNIVRYYENDIIQTESPKTYDIYILMEYLTPFPDYFETKNFTVKDVIRLGKDILTALISCHEKNIIHRDIKDDNIFVSADGVYKLGDFGVSKSLKDKSRAESVKGTPNFIAPEVYLGKEKYDNTVDLYSLGVVLYKLLNKSRNPFLPAFPAPYSTNDEDTAFEARMRGEIPELPTDAQNSLGEAVLKAVMPRNQRYDTATEFLNALVEAEKALNEEELSKTVNIIQMASVPQRTLDVEETPDNKNMSQTVGTEFGSKDVTMAPESDKHLFDTFATAPKPKPQPVAPQPVSAPVFREEPKQEPKPKQSSCDKYDDEFEKEAIMRKESIKKWLMYLSPVIIALIYITVYLIVIPKMYGKAVSVVEWLFSGPRNIIDTLKEPKNVLSPIYAIIGLKIFNWVLSIAFIASLFCLGYALQNSKPKTSKDAKLVGHEPYVVALDLHEQIKAITAQNVSLAKKAVYSVCERLKNESEFGSGSATVISCENEIAMYLKGIEENIPALYEESTVEEATKNIETFCQKVLSKLKIRIELKKR